MNKKQKTKHDVKILNKDGIWEAWNEGERSKELCQDRPSLSPALANCFIPVYIFSFMPSVVSLLMESQQSGLGTTHYTEAIGTSSEG